jgi:hypothetical protein
MRARGRLILAVVASVLVVGVGAVFQRLLGSRPPGETVPTTASSGAWFCPHGGGEGWRAWVVVANPTDRPAEVRMTTYGRGRPRSARTQIPPASQRYLEAPAPGMASASVVEFFGAPVAAGMVTRRGDGGGLAAEPCAANAARHWYVPEGTSVRGQAAHLVVVNPFAQDAVVDVVIATEHELIRHGNLSGVVVEAGRARAFELNRFALGEETLTAEVRVPLGRVAVAGFGVGADGGLRSILGVSRPSTTWILPAAGDADPTRVLVEAPTGADAPLQILTQGSEGSKVVLEEESVGAHTAETFELPQGGEGVLVDGAGAAPFVAGRRLTASSPDQPPEPERRQGPRRDGRGRRDRRRHREEEPAPTPDLASTAGVPAPASSWVAVSPLPPEGGPALLVIQNPGTVAAEGRIVQLSEDGPVRDPIDFRLDPGHTVVGPLGDEGSQQPLAVVVRLSGGEVAVAQVAADPEGFAVGVGIPGTVTAFRGLGI